MNKEYLDFTNQVLDGIRPIIDKYYRRLEGYEKKGDSSPVTKADKEVEEYIRNQINAAYKDHGIFGEEHGTENVDAKYVWTIDPIDGTKSFLIGKPLFTTLISLLENGKPVFGSIYQPILGDKWIGFDGYAKIGDVDIKTSDCNTLSEARICTTGPDYFSKQEWQIYQQVSAKCGYSFYGGDGYNYGLLAMGNLDIIIESGLKPYDYCPLVAVIEAAGGVVTNWQGKAVDVASQGDIVACANKDLHKQVLEEINK